MNNVNDDEKYEPGSPTNFTFSTIGRLSKKKNTLHRDGVYRRGIS